MTDLAPEDALFVVGLAFFLAATQTDHRFAAGVAAALVIVTAMMALGRLVSTRVVR